MRELDRKKLGARKVIVGHGVPADLVSAGDLVVDLPGLGAVGDEDAPVLDVLVGQLLAFFRCLSIGPPARHALRRGRDQPRRGGLRHPPPELTTAGMKRVLVVGRDQRRPHPPGLPRASRAGQGGAGRRLRHDPRQRLRDLRDGARPAGDAGRLPGHGGRGPLGRLLRGRDARGRHRRLPRGPATRAQDGRHRLHHLARATARSCPTWARSRALRAEDVADAAFRGLRPPPRLLVLPPGGAAPSCAALFARARAAGLTTSLDPGFDPGERWEADLVETLREVDLFFPNEVELRGDHGHGRRRARRCARLENGRTRIVAKLGARGLPRPSRRARSLERARVPRGAGRHHGRRRLLRRRLPPRVACAAGRSPSACAGARPAAASRRAAWAAPATRPTAPRSSVCWPGRRDHGRRLQHLDRQGAGRRRAA